MHKCGQAGSHVDRLLFRASSRCRCCRRLLALSLADGFGHGREGLRERFLRGRAHAFASSASPVVMSRFPGGVSHRMCRRCLRVAHQFVGVDHHRLLQEEVRSTLVGRHVEPLCLLVLHSLILRARRLCRHAGVRSHGRVMMLLLVPIVGDGI